MPADPATGRRGVDATAGPPAGPAADEGGTGDEGGPGRDLTARIDGAMLSDRVRLRRRAERGTGFDHDLARSEARVEARRAARPTITYPDGLPVSERRDEIRDAIAAHQVVIVAGETGSGKTTQIPKICLEMGRGVVGMIGHTQPRRLAARTVAERIADELDVPLGGAVGYAVRFNDRVGETTLVKLMTDGILLAEMPRDRLLERYDTIIIDEAHERSLNIDFLLGYLARLLPQRPDLKVIVTSATIDTQRFSEHFGGAPIVEVSGRTWPVEVRYQPVVDDADDRDRDQTEAICDAVAELAAEGPGDVLVFLSGEREIRDTADAVARLALPHTEVLPLYARLSAAEQHRVFRAHPGRRVVLATNVAETSITVPGIRSVVDPGTARISRYSTRTKVQRLPIEPVSQASANQRAGRCGRVGPGVCIRLYSEDDFEHRPEFTDPEILRTNLASVILQMAALRLGAIEDFPFVDPPDGRQVTAGLQLLEEIGALAPSDGAPVLTTIGRRLARLPVDPRLGRMILEAERNACVREVTIVAAALSIQDPREWPADKRAEAAEHHRRFADPESDFVAYLHLWEYVRDQQRALSSSQFRRLCRRELLNFQRVREWQDLVTQLRQVTHDLGIRPDRGKAERDALHRSLLAGLLSQIGVRDDGRGEKGKGPDRREPERRRREYEGARGTRFVIGGHSGLEKKMPRWVMAAELVETNRLWARTVARIEPEWAEKLGADLVRRSYGEPMWDRRRAATVALERVTLYGVPIVTSRRVDYARLDPEVAHEMFVRHALVDGDWDTHHKFLAANESAAASVRALEDRVRRRDLLVDDEDRFDLYDGRIPQSVVSGRTFDRWYRDAPSEAMRLSPADLVDPGAGRIRFEDWPDTWHHDGVDLALSYVYDPLSDDDGVTVQVPLALLNRVGPSGWDWQIPGLRVELVSALVRSLPRDVRRSFVPAADHARAFLQDRGPADGGLLVILADWLATRAGVPLRLGRDALEQLPAYLRVTFAVVDARGRTMASSKDLAALRNRLHRPLRQLVADANASLERRGATTWDFGTLPLTVDATVATSIGPQIVRGYPSLVDEGATVGVRVLADAGDGDELMWEGTRRLLLLAVTPPVARAARALPNDAKLALGRAPHADLAALLADCSTAVIDRLLLDAGGPVRDATAWDRLLQSVRAGAADGATRIVTRTALALSWSHVVATRLDALHATVLGPSTEDIRAQLDRLVRPGFVTSTGGQRLIDLIRYLKAIERRLDKLAEDPFRDRERMRPVQRLEAELQRVSGGRGSWTGAPEVDAVRWMIEELRVSIWAQKLGTPGPVSEARIRRAIDRLSA